MTADHREKRDYFSKKRLQMRYVLYYLLLLVGSSSFLGYLIYRRTGAALRAEMYLSHSSTTNTWEIMGREIISTSASVTALIVGGALLITLGITWIVHSASTALRRDLQSYVEKGLDLWTPIRHPREFRHLQNLLADALRSHRDRLSRLDDSSAALLEEVRRVGGGWAREGLEVKHARLRNLHVRFERLRASFGAFRMKVR